MQYVHFATHMLLISVDRYTFRYSIYEHMCVLVWMLVRYTYIFGMYEHIRTAKRGEKFWFYLPFVLPHDPFFPHTISFTLWSVGCLLFMFFEQAFFFSSAMHMDKNRNKFKRFYNLLYGYLDTWRIDGNDFTQSGGEKQWFQRKTVTYFHPALVLAYSILSVAVWHSVLLLLLSLLLFCACALERLCCHSWHCSIRNQWLVVRIWFQFHCDKAIAFTTKR